MIPQEVIAEDRQLQADGNKISERTMWLRWHWTLDESNPDRVSFSEYARQVGLGPTIIANSANGYVIFLGAQKDHPENPISPAEAKDRANMSAERRRPMTAVAKARGVSSDRVRKVYRDEVDRVTSEIDDYADEHPEAAPEDLDAIAERHARNIAAASKLAKEQRDKLLRSQPHLLTELQGELAKAREALIAARALTRDADRSLLPDDAIGHLDSAIQEITSLASDVRVFLGTVNWDPRLV
jgi:hypothetical protein